MDSIANNDAGESDLKGRFLQSVIDAVGDSIIVIGTDFRVLLMNRSARQYCLGEASFSDGIYCYSISHNRDRPCSEEGEYCALEQVLQSKGPITVTHHHSQSNGRKQVVEINASPVFDEEGNITAVIEVLRDITERLRLEEARRRLDDRSATQKKEESLLTLTGGIAHDFNNLLMALSGNAELLRLRLPPGSKERELNDGIMVAAMRMAELTRQLLSYAKGGIQRVQKLSVNDLVKVAVDRISPQKMKDIKTDIDLAPDLPVVSADAGQITQVLTNIMTNAAEAMEPQGGVLAIHTEKKYRQAWTCQVAGHEHHEGYYVCVRISDTGHGMTDKTLKRIFDPFFSTRFMGRGLGLPVAAGIIKRLNGCISVESETGNGTTFYVYLPVAADVDQTMQMKRAKPSEAPSPARRILLIDDDLEVLSIVSDMLSHLGYNVMTVAGGRDVFELADAEILKRELAIVDLQMPGVNGKGVAERLKTINPGMKVLVSSGYDRKTTINEMKPYVPDGFIQKPYRMELLQETISELLRK